ncbi:hypothetical protein P3G55_18970 [Leptospira sp. 96542]|nr:hypothetical protein [Leptospira sp. 96542]
MSVTNYQFPVEKCDVPLERRKSLEAYREHRLKCLFQLQGDSDTSVARQVYDLVWHTMMLRTLNEARRLEPNRMVNGDMWNLATAGYATLMTMGIRRLVDKSRGAISIPNILHEIERHPEFLTREFFVCNDGLPFEDQESAQPHSPMQSETMFRWAAKVGPKAYDSSRMRHEAFDKLCGKITERKRNDTVVPEVFETLRASLSANAISKVRTMADKIVAHTERVPDDKPIPIATYQDIDDALKIIVRTSNFIGHFFFFDEPFGTVVATPQYNVMDRLDRPWVQSKNIPALHEFWNQQAEVMDKWAYNVADGFLA